MNTNIWEIKELSQKEICKEKEVEYDPSVGDYFGVTFFNKLQRSELHLGVIWAFLFQKSMIVNFNFFILLNK